MDETIYRDGSYMTHAGDALLTRLMATGQGLVFTRCEAGNGTFPEGTSPKEMTALGNPIMEGKIARISNPRDGELYITIEFDNTQISQGFRCSELGLFARNTDGTEILYTYGSLAEEPEWIRPNGEMVGKIASFTLITIVDSAEIASITIDPAAVAGTCYGVLDLTIPASGWVPAEVPSADHNYTCDVPAATVTSVMIPTGGPRLGSMGIASSAGVVGGCETMDGFVRFFSKRIPSADIEAHIILLSRGQNDSLTTAMLGEGLVLQSGKLTIAIGEGLEYDDEGKLAVDTASDAETNAALDDIFSSSETL